MCGKNGIDVIVGTHALLSSGLNYKDLGLLVVDEEQDELAALAFDDEAIADLHREDGAGLVVVIRVGCASGVVENER